MKINVDAAGYDSAADALYTANQLAASAYTSLTSKMGGWGAMGGDDKSSEDFVKGYDQSAAAAVGALGDLVDAFASVGALSKASGANHKQANEASHIDQQVMYDGSQPLPDDKPVDVADYTPPSALGGDNADLPEFWNLVVDHLQGYAWPSANTDRLRSAGSSWAIAAGDVEQLTRQCDSAISELSLQRSPEIPQAVQAIQELKGHVTGLAAEFRSIGEACTDYAEQVEGTREAIKDLLKDLAIEAGISVAAGIVVGIFTFGGGAAAGTGIAAWRAVSCATKILKVLKALKVVRAVSKVAKTFPKVRSIRSGLEKYKNVKKAQAATKDIGKQIWTPGRVRSNPKNALGHFKKHQSEFPDCKNAKEYVEKAQNFMGDPPTGTYTKVRPNGDIIRFNPKTDEFGIMEKDGTLKTFFKPDPSKHNYPSNWEYFLGQ